MLRERSLFFSSRNHGARSSRGGSAAAGTRGRGKCKWTDKKRPWKVSFICLASKYDTKVSNTTEKLILQKA